MNRTRQETVVINMGDFISPIRDDVAAGDVAESKDKKKQTTLFGPSIGVVNSGPDWADLSDKKPLVDELTPEVVDGWVAKSKESTQPTTTLQALVNLKRPSLRLSPLALAASDDPEHKDSHDHHGLEFEYDCDAPKCGIRVHVLCPEKEQSAVADRPNVTLVDVFDVVVDGGFGRVLKLEEGATLELGKLERWHLAGDVTALAVPDTSGGARASTEERGNTDTPNVAAPTNGVTAPRNRKRFTINFRKRAHERPVTGPALAVVDAVGESADADGTVAKGKESKDGEEGVKVAIRLAALDKEGQELASPNAQTTYLQVVRFGAAPGDGEEDVRPWVVKVVKREATIGPHTFSLHEIYGLATHSTAPTQFLPPTSLPPSSPDHAYPPTAPPPTTHEEDPTSECLLCLSSPREVLLLPCRHLVACRECAVNMVEFGAGGALVHSDEAAAGDGAGAGVGGGPGVGGSTDVGVPAFGDAAGPVLPGVGTPATRRKRKAKGWFCPVCRQPYTSLLRITTTPPEKEKDDPTRASTSNDGDPPAPAVTAVAAEPRGLAALTRPGFLRSFSRTPSSRAVPTTTELTSAAAPTVPAFDGEAAQTMV